MLVKKIQPMLTPKEHIKKTYFFNINKRVINNLHLSMKNRLRENWKMSLLTGFSSPDVRKRVPSKSSPVCSSFRKKPYPGNLQSFPATNPSVERDKQCVMRWKTSGEKMEIVPGSHRQGLKLMIPAEPSFLRCWTTATGNKSPDEPSGMTLQPPPVIRKFSIPWTCGWCLVKLVKSVPFFGIFLFLASFWKKNPVLKTGNFVDLTPTLMSRGILELDAN